MTNYTDSMHLVEKTVLQRPDVCLLRVFRPAGIKPMELIKLRFYRDPETHHFKAAKMEAYQD